MAVKQARERHVHKFQRHTYKSGTSTFFCVLPDCSFKVSPPFALGKNCICHKCGETFQMDEYAIRLAKPHCKACHRPKGGAKTPEPVLESAKEIMHIPEPVRSTVDDMRARLRASQNAATPDDEDI